MNREMQAAAETRLPTGAVMVVGGGISGMQSALDLANSGFKVYLVESSPAIGGKMAQLDKTFPTNDCSMCIVSPKLVEVGRHENIVLLTHAELRQLEGQEGNFTATIVSRARYVDANACTGCGLCEIVCPVSCTSYFPEKESGKKKKSSETHTITGTGTPVAQSDHAWNFTVNTEKCKKCGLCFRACLQEAISWEKGTVAAIEQARCTGCGACYTACPEKFSAIEIGGAAEMEKSLGAALVARSAAMQGDRRGKSDHNCIRCGLCAMMCSNVMGIGALKMVEQGIEARVADCQVCGACVAVCPVGFLDLQAVTNRQPRPLYDAFNEGLNTRKPINIFYPQAVPRVPVIDEKSCVHLNSGECGICQSVCGADAIDYQLKEKVHEIAVGSVIFSPGIEVFDAKRRGEYGYGTYKNVVTSIEFERLLSASGPTSGQVLRPGDGAHPRKIAWIQCVGSRDHSCDHDYCSSVCCMYATKEAYIAREHDKEIEPTIFYMDMRSFGKNFDDYVHRAKDKNVRYIRSMVSKVYEDPQTGNLELRYFDGDGARIRESFDMVVLSVGLQVPETTKKLAATLAIEVDRFGFAKTDTFAPLATTRPGVYVSGAFNGPKDIPETVSEASAAAEAASVGLVAARDTEIAGEILPDEREIAADEELRIGVFICHCGTNIASVVDVAAVTEYAKTLPGVVYVEHPLYTCSQDSQEHIRELIEKHRLNRIVASACSPTTHEPLFMSTIRQAGLNKYFFDMANIRDQCSWVHPTEPEAATDKAKRLTRMAVANSAQAEPLRELAFDVDARLLIIGGGVAGMTAALEAAAQGFGVYLVEKERRLGGQLNHLRRSWDNQPMAEYLANLRGEIEQNENIKVFVGSVVVDHSGFVGSFETEIMTPSTGSRILKHGAILLATGGREHRPELYGLDQRQDVVTQTDFENMLEDQTDRLQDLSHVVMVQCVGSRDEQWQSYCSRTCCNQAVKNGLNFKKLNPQARVDVLYRDMRCYGMGETNYREARRQGINFIHFEKETAMPVIETENQQLSVEILDRSIKMNVRLQPDLLVLATGVTPRDTEELSSMLRCTRNDNGFFIEAHAKLRPVDLPSEGLFMAGGAHGPKDVTETITQAQAAVARAVTILSKEKLTMSAVVSWVDPQNCAVCLTCVRACPYGVPVINDNHTAEINPALCQGCGICVAECPAKTIFLHRYDDRNINSKLISTDGRRASIPEEVA